MGKAVVVVVMIICVVEWLFGFVVDFLSGWLGRRRVVMPRRLGVDRRRDRVRRPSGGRRRPG